MMCSIQCNSRANRRTALLLAIFTTGFCFLGGAVFAQDDFGAPQPRGATLKWVVGPASAPLGDSAEITIPEGCRFTDEFGARTVLISSRQPVPANLLGLLYPDSGHWLAIVQFTDIGYVKDAGKINLDADAILKKFQEDVARQSRERATMDSRVSIPDISWAMKPVYDPALNKLEYALKAEGASGGSVNYVVDWLGRRGMLSVTIVQPEQAAFNLASLRDAVKGITFKSGDRYQDHREGDRVARFGLVDLILNPEGIEPPSRLARLMQHHWFWAAAAGGVTVFAAAGVWLTVFILKKRKVRYYRMDDKYQRHPSLPLADVANGHAANSNGQPYAGGANGQAVAAVNGGFQRNGHRRRKKRFSYHAFYSDMVMNLTRSNYVGAPSVAYAGVEAAQAAGHEALPSGSAQAHNGNGLPDAAHLLVAETSKLIQSQQKLIEGQRKLIEEQSRLIQEKSMLLGADIKPVTKQPEAFAEEQTS